MKKLREIFGSGAAAHRNDGGRRTEGIQIRPSYHMRFLLNAGKDAQAALKDAHTWQLCRPSCILLPSGPSVKQNRFPVASCRPVTRARR